MGNSHPTQHVPHHSHTVDNGIHHGRLHAVASLHLDVCCLYHDGGSGGIKCIRVLTIWKAIVNEFRLILHPHAVFPLRINSQPLPPAVVRNVFVFVACYFGLTLVGSIALMAMGLSMMDAVSCCITTLSNVGPGYGHLIGPLDSWNVLPDAALWINSFLMLAGRLEIFSLLLPFVPDFWRDN